MQLQRIVRRGSFADVHTYVYRHTMEVEEVEEVVEVERAFDRRVNLHPHINIHTVCLFCYIFVE